jgi:hypothetical protein
MWIVYIGVALFVIVGAYFARLLHRKNVDIIIAGQFRRRPRRDTGTKHVLFCLVDHYEPLWHRPPRDVAIERVRNWLVKYPGVVDRFRDNSGRTPQHSFFYPEEEYIPECLDMLATLRDKGYGDVEIHLHHDKDTSEGFREKILGFKHTLHDRHGLLHKNPSTGGVEYGFIHGMWALDDSANGKWCGVKDEITVLKETGCYADFTFPSAPDITQPPVINRIYYATDDPLRSKSHHRGVDAAYGKPGRGDLLLITGPLAINWKRRNRNVFPVIENCDITGRYPPTPDRVDLWVNLGIGVRDWPSWVFVKVHTHGCQEKNSGLFLSERINGLYERLLGTYNEGTTYVLHFMTAHEMYVAVKALESGSADWIKRIEAFDYGWRQSC